MKNLLICSFVFVVTCCWASPVDIDYRSAKKLKHFAGSNSHEEKSLEKHINRVYHSGDYGRSSESVESIDSAEVTYFSAKVEEAGHDQVGVVVSNVQKWDKAAAPGEGDHSVMYFLNEDGEVDLRRTDHIQVVRGNIPCDNGKHQFYREEGKLHPLLAHPSSWY